MRIGCLQFAPQVGDVNNNLNRADSVLSKANPDDLAKLDLLVLPELCFSGYNFRSLEHISPYLEPTTAGITSLWARTTALKYNCVVTAGYPEKVDMRAKWPTGPEYYNSAITVNAEGETVANYRKTFLYMTDETWALEGKGFYSGQIEGLGNVAMGICMDLNPYKFEAPWNAWEFSYHVLFKHANLVVMSMAWLTREDITTFSRTPHEPDMETLSYWLSRLEPLIRAETVGEIIVVIANRCGNEEEVVYAGTSTVLGIESGEVKVYGILGRGDKELLVVDTDRRPKAKLVSEPSSAASTATDTTAHSRETDASGSTAYTSPDEDMAEDMEDYNNGYSSLSPGDPKHPGYSGLTSSDDESFYRESLPSGGTFTGQTPSPRFPVTPDFPPSPQTRGRSRTRAQPAPVAASAPQRSPWEHHEKSSIRKAHANSVAHISPQLSQPPSPQTRGRTRDRTRDREKPKEETNGLSNGIHSRTTSPHISPPKKRGRTRDRTRDRSVAKPTIGSTDMVSPTLAQPPTSKKRDRTPFRAREPIVEPMPEPVPEPILLSPTTYSPTFAPSKQSPTTGGPTTLSAAFYSPKTSPKEAPATSPGLKPPSELVAGGRPQKRGEPVLSLDTRDSPHNTKGIQSNAPGISTLKSPLPPGSAVPDHYQSFFTTRTFGERSDHISPRPRSAYY